MNSRSCFKHSTNRPIGAANASLSTTALAAGTAIPTDTVRSKVLQSKRHGLFSPLIKVRCSLPILTRSKNSATHIPFEILPDSIRESDCRIIYICRNPLDVFISQRQFLLENKIAKDAVPLELDEAFDMFCRGITSYGPFWDHMLGYWNAHLKNPERMLFLKYEDLKEDILSNVKKIAEFMGLPFSPEEEKQGVVEQISRLCSFENLKNLEVNKSGNVLGLMKNSSFFRKGEVGDWVNYLTPEMAERVKNIMESKFQGSGLIFNI
ncbi:UNVERIFIED_CONTAM: Cytosolic sulfotransferase 14 [Sesamum radiatum]|uniref:Sulfotransferase n=1 Tax=Sesamum radiatum TaxID=300843 RepID=A0AAW2TWH5_SESRA